eukprot:jgi/Tetstr1/435740/TSEL_024638.t1
MDSEIFLAWFTEHFLPFTADLRSEKTPVVLVLDNFSGHVHPTTLKMARENNVIMVEEEEEEEQDGEEDEEGEVQEEGEGGARHHEPPTDRRHLAMPVPQPLTAP